MDNGGAAFPSLHYKSVELGEEGKEYASFEGMTLRDYFAAKEMTKTKFYHPDDLTDWRSANQKSAQKCYLAADAMLKARDAEKK